MPEPSAADLLRWAETLAGIARTGLGFTQSLYEKERFEEVLKVAADIRAAAIEEAESRRAVRRVARVRRARACRATSRRRSRWPRSSATTRASSCSPSGPIPGCGCTRSDGPTSATRRPRSRSKRSTRRPASRSSRCRSSPCFDGLRLGFARVAAVLAGVPLPGARRRAHRATRSRPRQVGFFARDKLPVAARRRSTLGRHRVRRHRRRDAAPPTSTPLARRPGAAPDCFGVS